MSESLPLALSQTLTNWRHHFHRRPETGFAEYGTSDHVAVQLTRLGIEVHRGIGGTGLVGVLRRGNFTGRKTIALRAEMDALPIHERAEGRAYASEIAGTMHACGHDGHMAMVLGAAQLLALAGGFEGTVLFVFQPAEEHGKGAQAMLDDGLLRRFPMDEIYGVHNMPGIAAGHIVTRAGGIMASEDNFTIDIVGRGTHAARPHMGVDPIVVGAEIVLALQTIVARSVDPVDPAVVSVTEFVTDGIRNAIPTHVTLRGDTRSYASAVQALLERRMGEIVQGVCATHGAQGKLTYTHEFLPTVNPAEQVDYAVAAATKVVGAARVDGHTPPILASEDFGTFLRHVPGNFAFIGNGAPGEPGGLPLHNAGYDFNDSILAVGAAYFTTLVRDRLAP
ncbi:amidohydrolase [Rhodoferax koreense]|uniref:Amidohydrolase n=1 Tax=Rhodoferax koreensis TaxID=1842727 RepID=A0A1P8JXM0_9BURK|nr:M20 aminoacylase family protein [Rhodoferax koreense]APW38502.1 amidohydrolase [Rhodoferax koreense]